MCERARSPASWTSHPAAEESPDRQLNVFSLSLSFIF